MVFSLLKTSHGSLRLVVGGKGQRVSQTLETVRPGHRTGAWYPQTHLEGSSAHQWLSEDARTSKPSAPGVMHLVVKIGSLTEHGAHG